MKVRSSVSSLILLLAAVGWAQSLPNDSSDPLRGDARGRVAVSGEVSSEVPLAGSLTVELAPNSGGAVIESVPLGGDGSFEFRAVAPGDYELRITGFANSSIYRERVQITGANQRLTIRVPAPSSGGRSGEATVSLRQLQHKIPPQAQKAFDKGQSAAAKGKQEEAAEQFRRAVSVDPEFAEAYNSLGAAYVALGELPEAAEQFQKTIDLEPEHRMALPNLAIVLGKMKHFHEAAQVARRALKVVPGMATVRFILAVSLLAEHSDSAEALDNLQRAAPEIPKARLLAANLLARNGRREDAVKQLEEYLRATPAQDAERSKVEAWLAQLQNSSAEGRP